LLDVDVDDEDEPFDEVDEDALLDDPALLPVLPLDSEPPQANAIIPNIGTRAMGIKVRCMVVLQRVKVPENRRG
ncbi:MAG TPA: hypothetical protein PKA58_37980, partial [Polyangium sp.]|nr:hypothetical protein [Polyangium sp.]